MTTWKNTVTIALAASIALGTVAAQAAPFMVRTDLPILVDRFYEIKHPAGPVSAVVMPEALKDPQIFYVMPDTEIPDVPNPQWEQQFVLQH